jgi:hypothetical protein
MALSQIFFIYFYLYSKQLLLISQYLKINKKIYGNNKNKNLSRSKMIAPSSA